jgi:hypothetical protein
LSLFSKVGAQALRQQIAESNAMDRGERIEQEFLEQLNAFYASPASGFHDNRIARSFYEQKLRYLKWNPYPNDGLVTFGASGTDKCDLEVFFRNQQVKAPKSDDLPFRGRQRRIGSAVIEYLQLDMIHMPKVLGDKAKFVIANVQVTGGEKEYAFEDAAQMRKVFEYNGVKFAITAKPDGILSYRGEEKSKALLFEYKTKATGIRSMNSKLDFKGPDEGHLRQVTAESLIFGIREGIILYESTQKPDWFGDEYKSSVTKGQKTWADGKPLADIRPFYFNITDDMQEKLLADLAKQARMVYEGEQPKVTVDCVQQCGFCPYFGGHCHSSITAENLEELRSIERNYANSNLAGKSDHKKLMQYLEVFE